MQAQRRRAWWQAAPAALWLTVFFAAPLILIVLYSFQSRSPDGTVAWTWNLDNYRKLVGDESFRKVLWQSVWFSLVVTFITLLISYPLAYFISTRSKKWRIILLFAVMLPFWTNFLVRIYAWKMILSSDGLLNQLLEFLGIIGDNPLDRPRILNTPWALLLSLIYGELPYMILPLYATLERFDHTQLEAAHDLGAGRWSAFWRIMLPQTMAGITAGSILVFIPTIGTFAVSDILGGPDATMIGNFLDLQFRSGQNWPYGSAMAMIFMVLLLVAIWLYFRVTQEAPDGENPR